MNTVGECKSDRCNPSCEQCKDDDADSCTFCYENATLTPNGACECNEYYAFDESRNRCKVHNCDNSCYSCESMCHDCCIACHEFAVLDHGKCDCIEEYFMNPATGECIEHNNFLTEEEVYTYFDSHFNLVVRFTSDIVKSNITTCEDAFSDSTLYKLGKNPTLTWDDNLPLFKISLGPNSRVHNREIELNGGNFIN